MSRLRLTSKYFPIGVILLLTFLVFGCSNHENPLEATGGELQPGDVVPNPTLVVVHPAAKNGTTPSLSSGTTTRKIRAEKGGTISNGRITIDFPPYALEEDTFISISMDASGLLIVDCGPDGTEFDRDVVLTMDLTGTSEEGNASEVFIMWLEEGDEDPEWELIEMLPAPDENHVQGILEHFSKYGSGVGG